MYAKENNVPLVKPFILVVCKNTTHAAETVELIENRIYEGRYKGKVLQIDSTTKNKNDEIDKQFVSLGNPGNEIEIVVHVNMLKEGWDVTNLYTIVPLRAADITSGYFDNPVNEIVAQLMNFEEVDYDENSELLYHLAQQAVDAVGSQSKDQNEVASKVHQFKAAIANRVFGQMKEHFTLENRATPVRVCCLLWSCCHSI